jgi:hypothetical protein
MLKNIFNKAALKSDWICWLITNNSDAARSTLEFINTCFINIPLAKRKGILKKLNSDKYQVEATIHELVAHELLRRLRLSPEFEPRINGLTPDLSFRIEGKAFIADVYLTHSPSKAFKDFNDGTGQAWDTAKLHESRAHKIEQELANKTVKYSQLKVPLVVFIFFGDHRILSVTDVERALFGMTSYEINFENRFPKSICCDQILVGGLLLPTEDSNYKYGNLSAVIACDWFDTLNRQDPGKRLHCLVLHNWAGDVLLPTDAFKVFPQIVWNQMDSGVWKPSQTLNRNIVAKFMPGDEIKCYEYTPSTAW